MGTILSAPYASAFSPNAVCTGVFGAQTQPGVNDLLTAEGQGAALTFDASKSNSIYGSSETVQPPAICLIPQIKY